MFINNMFRTIKIRDFIKKVTEKFGVSHSKQEKYQKYILISHEGESRGLDSDWTIGPIGHNGQGCRCPRSLVVSRFCIMARKQPVGASTNMLDALQLLHKTRLNYHDLTRWTKRLLQLFSYCFVT